ncbi:CDP-alcohol phosphatidyltransferase family protein [bacterium]|nr:CDP-alcohol phosphatidyltransferase family protein [bacterium]
MVPGLNLANQITLSRLALGPLFLICYLSNFYYYIEAALIVAILIEATDVADGIAARSRKQVSDIGKLLDPMSDTIARISYYIGFLVLGYAAAWMVAILVYRDVVIAYLRVFTALTGTAMGRRKSGQWKGIIQGAAALIVLTMQWVDLRFWNIPYMKQTTFGILAFVTAYTLFTLVEYLLGNRELLKEIHRRGRPV